MKGMIAVIATGVIFLIIGLACLLRAKEIQRWGIEYYDRNKDLAKLNPFLSYMKSDAYLVVTRIIGLVCLTGFIFMVFVLVRESLK